MVAKLNDKFSKNQHLEKKGKVVPYLHRPFVKKWLYWDDVLNERASSYRDIENIMGKVLYMQGADFLTNLLNLNHRNVT